MYSSYSLSVWLLTILSVLGLVNGTATKLIVFAGPHKAASTSVEEFFYEAAAGHSRWDANGNRLPAGVRKKTFGLRFWSWPHPTGEATEKAEPDAPYKIYGHLISEPSNEALKSEILTAVRLSWETVDIQGVILGSELFDQVGKGVEYDATKALQEIVEFIDAKPYEVTVVLNYRTPRLDHWASMWKHDSTGVSAEGENYALEYEEWLCDKSRALTHELVLATQMNPLNAAEEYAKLGYNVRLIDLEGVLASNRDVVHVIACDIASAICDDGMVRNHDQDDLHKNSISKEFAALTPSQRTDAESLFRYRDCAYRDLDKNSLFGVMYPHSVWRDCNNELNPLYERLRDDPSYMYRALVGQITCPESTGNPVLELDSVSMQDALGIKPSKGSDTPASGGGNAASAASGGDATAPGGGDDATGVGAAAPAPAATGGGDKGKGGGFGRFLVELLVFLGIFVGGMGVQYARMTRTTSQYVGASSSMFQSSSSSSSTAMGSLNLHANELELEGQFSNGRRVAESEFRDEDVVDDDGEHGSTFRD